MKKNNAIIMAVALTVFAATNALACGESLFRVGKGVKYRAYSAPLPANVLVYATSEKEKAIAAELAKSGHGVYVVSDAVDLAQQIGKGGYDIVIAPFSQRQAVEAQVSDAAYLPITQDANEADMVKGLYKRSVGSDDDIKHYLKAIHRSLKQA